MGSVKDLTVLKNSTADEHGVGNFNFSDRYSVFDWGEMPDHITNKGKALCLIGAYFFEKLESMNIHTHYLGLVHENSVKHLSELTKPVDIMQVKLLQVLKPPVMQDAYDYSIYHNDLKNFLIPLEIIYRNALPEGSSVFKRLNEGSLTLSEMGLNQMPVSGQILSPPILDVSTKLEATDRYLSWEEAKNLAGISDDELADIKRTTLLIDEMITEQALRIGLVQEDGKLEFGMDANRRLLLVDVLGTPDECRFAYEGIPVSKEVARIYYRKTLWYESVSQAKLKDQLNWKQHVPSPPPLPVRLHELISQLYMAFCNELTEKSWFQTPHLKDILADIKSELAI